MKSYRLNKEKTYKNAFKLTDKDSMPEEPWPAFMNITENMQDASQ